MATVDLADVLDKVLAVVLSFVGPDEHLFICGISKAYHAEYHINRLKAEDSNRPHRCGTSHQAAFASPSRLRLAVQCGFALRNNQFLAGKVASIDTLMTARQLGLSLDVQTAWGAAASGDLAKLRWLTEEHALTLSHSTVSHAAQSGCIEMVDWLRDQGFMPDSSALYIAAASDQMPMTLHLHSLGIPYGRFVWDEVLQGGYLDVLRLMLAEGELVRPSKTLMAYDAAISGNVEMLQYLEAQQEIFFHETCALHTAARKAHVAAVNWLLERGCQGDADLCRCAVDGAVIKGDVAMLTLLRERGLLLVSEGLCTDACNFDTTGNGHLLTLQWLREQALCPWNRLDLAKKAATARKIGSFAVLRHIFAQGEQFSPAELTDVLNVAVFRDNVIKAKWLRQQGAEWPAELVYADGTRWSDEMITWAVSEGYVSQDN